MRAWQAPAAADILVSELLGSLGDNELSPECLDGAQRFLKPDGLSIPAAYTSQLQPIAAFRVWSDVKVRRPQDGRRIGRLVRKVCLLRTASACP